MDLHDCQCPACQSGELESLVTAAIQPEAIYNNALICTSCMTNYDVIWGVPYLGTFEADDLLSLLEIAASIGTDCADRGDSVPLSAFRSIQLLLSEYHAAAAKSSFTGSKGEKPTKWGWWANRWNEYVMTSTVFQGLKLGGKKVLDVGAGTGFDSVRFVHEGAHVTALEFNPLLLRQGQQAFPELRWMGGSARVLPFRSGTFDVVAVNAALHHMRDLPTTFGELLRVVKAGGYLVTLCDSFRPSESDAGIELTIFDDQTSVLLGVNEGIPRFADFLTTLLQYGPDLDVQVFTHHVDGLTTQRGPASMNYPRAWNLHEALAILPKCSGALALVVQIRRPVMPRSPRVESQLIGCAEYAEQLSSSPKAMAALAQKVSPDYVNWSLHDGRHDKFRLLNGWKKPLPGQLYRTAYCRGRVFFRREAFQQYVLVEVLAPHVALTDRPAIKIFLDGEERLAVPLQRGLWTRFSLDIAAVSTERTFALEVHLDSALREQEALRLHFRRLELADRPLPIETTDADLEMYGLEALHAVGLLGPSPVLVAFAPCYEPALETVNRLRNLGLEVDAIVAQGQEQVFAWEKGVRVVGTYPDPTLDPDRPWQLDTPVRLLVAPSLQTASSLAVHLRGTNEYHIVLQGGFSNGPDALRAVNSTDTGCLLRATGIFSWIPSPLRRYGGAARRRLWRWMRAAALLGVPC
jgi:SAM-dependent methyltransferase/uncharacterized protein YbaR (Trm112 family)